MIPFPLAHWASGITLIDSFGLDGAGAGPIIAFGSGQNFSVGQGFAGAAKILTRIDIWLRNPTGATGNIVAKLYLATGTQGVSTTPTGAALATSALVSVASFSSVDPGTLVSFVFTDNYLMSAGTHYAFAIEDVSTTDHLFSEGLSKAGSFPPDNASQNGPGWTAFNTLVHCFGVCGI